MKTQATNWAKKCFKPISETGLVCRVYKEHSKLNGNKDNRHFT